MRLTTTVLALALLAGSANAAFSPFVIREGGGNAPDILPNNTYVPGALEYVISTGGMKAGLGSSDLDGSTVGSISKMAITRYDDASRFTAGSGPAVAPYFNIWVTDGLGNYAVIANEPSNPSFAPYRTANVGGGFTYDFSMADIGTEPVQVYETPNGGYGSTTTWVHNLLGNHPLTFADVASLTVEAPSAAYITNPSNAVGSGAPDELGTNAAFGFNWIFGDTLSNYVSGAEGYVVSNAILTPAPGAAGLLGLAGLAAARRRRR